MARENKSQKKVNYRELSDKRCTVCGKPLKKNIVMKNKHAKFCFVCFQLAKGKKESFAHKVNPNGDKIPLKRVDYIALQKANKRLYLRGRLK